MAHTISPSNMNKPACKFCRHFNGNSFGIRILRGVLLWRKTKVRTKRMKLFSTLFIKKPGGIWQIHKNIGVDSFQCDLDVGLVRALTPVKEKIIYSWRLATLSSLPRNDQRFFALLQFRCFTFCKICSHSSRKIAYHYFLRRKMFSEFHPC